MTETTDTKPTFDMEQIARDNLDAFITVAAFAHTFYVASMNHAHDPESAVAAGETALVAAWTEAIAQEFGGLSDLDSTFRMNRRLEELGIVPAGSADEMHEAASLWLKLAPVHAIIVSGDRHAGLEQVRWHSMLRGVLSNLQPRLVIHGAARGIDTIAEYVANGLGIPTIPFPADWKTHNRAAGPIRNQQMLDRLLKHQQIGDTVLVLACHDDLDTSKGTKHMTEIARKAGVPVLHLRSNGNSELLP